MLTISIPGKVVLNLKSLSDSERGSAAPDAWKIARANKHTYTLAKIISVNHGFHQFIAQVLLFQLCIQHDAVQLPTSPSPLLNISMGFSSTRQLSRKCFIYDKQLSSILLVFLSRSVDLGSWSPFAPCRLVFRTFWAVVKTGLITQQCLYVCQTSNHSLQACFLQPLQPERTRREIRMDRIRNTGLEGGRDGSQLMDLVQKTVKENVIRQERDL